MHNLVFKNNYYFLTKIGVDTAENEPSEIWPACLPRTLPLGRMNSYGADCSENTLKFPNCPRLEEFFFFFFFFERMSPSLGSFEKKKSEQRSRMQSYHH